MMKTLKQRGVYVKDIAAELGVHPRTVSRALQRGHAPQTTQRRRGSILDPYTAQLDQLLQAGVWNAVVLWREIQAQGYPGGLTLVRQYVHPRRDQRPTRATVRFETDPGHQLQSDWGELDTEIAGERTKVYFQVNTLGYSRRFHFWVTDRLDAEHTYEGLIRSFEYFGGVPREVLVDNQKAAVWQHPRGAAVVFNPRFVDLAGHYGFTPRACRPYRARAKGKDERMVGYVKHHFFVRYRSFASWAHLNQLAEQWLRDEADQRVQTTVKEVVGARFERERPHLHPLPAVRYDTAYLETRRVSWDAYIHVRGNRYSVPDRLVAQQVTIRLDLQDHLRVYSGTELVAQHTLQPASARWVTVTAHHRRLWQATAQVEQRSLQTYEELL